MWPFVKKPGLNACREDEPVSHISQTARDSVAKAHASIQVPRPHATPTLNPQPTSSFTHPYQQGKTVAV